MEPSFTIKYPVLLFMVSVLLQAYTSRCCLEHEKAGLLQLKSYFMAYSTSAKLTNYVSNELGSWDSNGERNCCLWNRVTCAKSVQHVTELSLDKLMGDYHLLDSSNKFLNVSLFRPFGELISLGLSLNNIQGLVGNGGHKRLSLRKLEILHLDGNFLQLRDLGDIVGSLPSLKELSLLANLLNGNFPGRELAHLKKLEVLDLSSNGLTGSLLGPELAHLNKLRVLDLSYNSLNGSLQDQGSIPASVGNITYLLALDLSNNNLFGEVPSKLFSDCTQLQFVLLSKNKLQGDIIPNYMYLPALVVLYLDNNNFGGAIKVSLNISQELQFFDISDNEATGEVPSWIGDLQNLNSMSLARNEFHGSIPSQLCNLKSLEFLDLSENSFVGEVPSCDRLFGLRFLHMHGNHFTGAIPNGLAKLSSLVTLDLNNNHLSGEIPPWIDQLSNLVVLLLRGNQLQGELPIQLCRLQNVNIIDLSNNYISGVIPTCFRGLSFGESELGVLYTHSVLKSFGMVVNVYWSYIFNTTMSLRQDEVEFIVKNRYTPYKGNILTIMSILDLSSNRLIGEIPFELGDLVMIEALNLSHNRLSGSIPRSFSKLMSIESLDLSNNNLSGAIPSELVDLTFLGTFNASYNNLSGQVPETGQFGTFDESNYRGNSFLCGSQLSKSCEIYESVSAKRRISNDEGDEVFDTEVFVWSFGMTYITVLLAFIAVLAINPHWRRVWFAYIDVKFLWWFHP